MGLTPILGGVSLVGQLAGMSSASQQRKIQEQQIAANQQAATAQYALQKAQAQSAKEFGDYRAQLEEMQRTFVGAQQAAGLTAQGILNSIDSQRQLSETQSNYTIQQMQLNAAKTQLQGGLAQTDINAAAKRSGALNKETNVLEQITQALTKQQGELTQGDKQLAAYEALLAASGINTTEDRTSNVVIKKQVENLLREALGMSVNTQEVENLAGLQRQYDVDTTNLQAELEKGGLVESLRRLATQQGLLDSAQVYDIQNIVANANTTRAGLNTTASMMEAARMQDQATSAANQLYANQGYQLQQQGLASQFGSQMASLSAQSASNRSSGGFLQQLPSLVSTAIPLVQGVVSNGNSQPQQQSRYSLYPTQLQPYEQNPNAMNIYSGSFLKPM